MFEPHICFNTPRDDMKIWRYMDFTKFMNLLDTQSLFFVRSDKFDDPFEGLFPRANKGWWTVGNKGEYDHRKQMELINAWHRKHTTINVGI